MFSQLKTDVLGLMILIGIILLFIEMIFGNPGLIFSFFIMAGCLYLGKKRWPRTSGKLFFWFGAIGLVITIFSTISFKLLMFALLIYLVVVFIRSRRHPVYIKPVIHERVHKAEKELVCSKPLLKNLLLGSQKTPDYNYEWKDINIQGMVGNTVIDLSNTVLPKGESVIVIRHLIGHIQILVPYEIEVNVNHSVIFGQLTIFHYREPMLFNQSLHFQTAEYEKEGQKIKIITSMMVGDIEVKYK